MGILKTETGRETPRFDAENGLIGLRWLLATSSFRRVQGLSLTSATVDDAPEIHDLYRRWERYWNVPLVTPFDEVAEIFADPHLEPDLDARMVRHEGRVVAFGFVSHIPSGNRLERVFLPGKVDPVMRGCGIGRRLLAWQIERAVEKLRTCDPELPWYVRLEEWEWVDDAHHLFRRFGFAPARWFEDMVRPLDTPLDVAVPPGVEILPWSESTPEETLRVSNASFADHWGSTERTLDSWKHTLSSSSVRLDLSYVARAAGELIGICLNYHVPEDTKATGRVDGWIAHLGVLSEWRRRGVAAALIAQSTRAFREVGFTHAMIGVDTANPSGASRLYRKLGFDPLHRSVTYQLQIHPAGTEG